jgi:hypothetical protein
MVQLMIYDEQAEAGATPQTVFGGRPSVAPGFAWPVCAACEGNMQFLGQLRAPAPVGNEDRLLLLFMCQNDPGLCDEWDAEGGGNAVIPTPLDDLSLAKAPEGETERATRHGAVLESVDEESYDEARDAWAEAHEGEGRLVLGQLGGEPDWLQSEETPDCDACNAPMRLIAQLEQGPDYETEMNFGGGGVAYVFECHDCGKAAKFLWQS